MGFASQQYRKEKQERPWKVNPVWRGIGCAFLILIPIMSWYGAMMIIQNSSKIPLSNQLNQQLLLPYSGVREVDQITAAINRFSVSAGLTTGQVLLTIVLMFIGFGILSVLYATMFRIAGPSRYGPFDVPPDLMKK